MLARPIVVRDNFQEVLDVNHTIQVKIRHLKGENKWESSIRLDSNGPDIGGLKATKG